MTLIKICGITNIEDANECVRLGANMLGFIFADSPRRVDVDTVKHINRIMGGDAKTVGVFTDEGDDVLSIMRVCELTYAQLHGGQSEDFARRLGTQRVIRVARVSSTPPAPSSPEEHGAYPSAVEDQPSFDTRSALLRTSGVYDSNQLHSLAEEYKEAAFYLLDTYKKGVPGGTGEAFDWDLAVRAKKLGKPVILSGGLTPKNVADAVGTVEPFAVDVSSGVEASPGRKDLAKVKEFIDNVRKADNRA